MVQGDQQVETAQPHQSIVSPVPDVINVDRMDGHLCFKAMAELASTDLPLVHVDSRQVGSPGVSIGKGDSSRHRKTVI